MSRLPLKGLEAFDSVARLFSFSLAAEELCVSQSAVSKQIQKLEESLGKTLISRGGRNLIVLTASGAALSKSVQPAFAFLRQATRELQPGLSSKHVTISTVPSFAAHWLIPRLAQFQSQQPNIAVRVETSMHLSDLRHGAVDIAIRYGLGDWPNTESQQLSAGIVIPVCSPSLVDRQELSKPSDLGRCALLHNVTIGEWSAWSKFYDQSFKSGSKDLILEDLNVVIQAAIEGHGVALVPEVLVKTALMSKALVEPCKAPLRVPTAFFIVYTNATPVPTSTGLVINWLQGHSEPTNRLESKGKRE